MDQLYVPCVLKQGWENYFSYRCHRNFWYMWKGMSKNWALVLFVVSQFQMTREVPHFLVWWAITRRCTHTLCSNLWMSFCKIGLKGVSGMILLLENKKKMIVLLLHLSWFNGATAKRSVSAVEVQVRGEDIFTKTMRVYWHTRTETGYLH